MQKTLCFPYAGKNGRIFICAHFGLVVLFFWFFLFGPPHLTLCPLCFCWFVLSLFRVIFWLGLFFVLTKRQIDLSPYAQWVFWFIFQCLPSFFLSLHSRSLSIYIYICWRAISLSTFSSLQRLIRLATLRVISLSTFGGPFSHCKNGGFEDFWADFWSKVVFFGFLFFAN